LGAGLSVVLDWPANTVAGRAWMRGIFEAAGAEHKLHFLDVPDEVCPPVSKRVTLRTGTNIRSAAPNLKNSAVISSRPRGRKASTLCFTASVGGRATGSGSAELLGKRTAAFGGFR
jgi:hypothetical protein